MHSPDSTQELAHLRETSGPSAVAHDVEHARDGRAAVRHRRRRPRPVIGQTSKHLPHRVQASTIVVTRSDNADLNVTAGWSLIARLWRTLEPFQEQLIAI